MTPQRHLPSLNLSKDKIERNKNCSLEQWYQFMHKPEHIPHFQKCLHGDSEQAGPTGSASYAAGCPVYKSDGSLRSTKRVALQCK